MNSNPKGMPVHSDADLILVAHGTRHTEGLQTIGELAAAVSEYVGPVRTAFVDVLGPNPREVLADSTRAAVVVPAFLASGYHVNTDLPARIAESGHPAARVATPLGPDRVIAEVMHTRLVAAGWRPGDAVVMAAAGSSDPTAHRDVARASVMLSDLVGDLALGFVATGAPRVAEVVRRLRNVGHRRVFIATYLLAPGVFHNQLRESGATAVADPLGAHPTIVRLLVHRFTTVPIPVAVKQSR